MLNRITFILLMIFINTTLCFAQGDGESKPLPPTIEVLTLNPGTGIPTITWTPPKYNPLYPDPTGYIIYRPLEGGGWLPIDTVGPETTIYTDINNNGLESSIQYTIATNGPTEPSQLANPHGSIYLTAEYDSCGNKLNIRWDQYVGWGNNIEKYDVYLGTSPNWENLALIGSTPLQQRILYHPIDPNRELYVYVEAKKRESELTTRSNLAFVSTKVARPPSYMYIDSIIALDRQTNLHFEIDNNTEYRKFDLVRWEQSDSIESIFSAKTLFQFTDPTTVYFSDTTDSWAARSRPFYFKINAYDGCNRIKKISNLSNSITIRAFTQGLKTTITWDEFYSAAQNPITYKVYRISFTPDVNPPELIYEMENPSEFSYVDDLSQFNGLGYMPNFCYYVEALETLEGVDNFRLSRSRKLCASVTPQVVMPNAIDPMSKIWVNGVPRNIFAPTISFISSYKLIIYSRWGGIVYEGTDTGWDGKLSTGEYAKEGSYVYRLEVYSESGRKVTKNGTVTVIYGPMR